MCLLEVGLELNIHVFGSVGGPSLMAGVRRTRRRVVAELKSKSVFPSHV